MKHVPVSTVLALGTGWGREAGNSTAARHMQLWYEIVDTSWRNCGYLCLGMVFLYSLSHNSAAEHCGKDQSLLFCCPSVNLYESWHGAGLENRSCWKFNYSLLTKFQLNWLWPHKCVCWHKRRAGNKLPELEWDCSFYWQLAIALR